MNDTTILNVRVACMCCRKATATWMIKDCGMKTYPVCTTCKVCCIVKEESKIQIK